MQVGRIYLFFYLSHFYRRVLLPCQKKNKGSVSHYEAFIVITRYFHVVTTYKHIITIYYLLFIIDSLGLIDASVRRHHASFFITLSLSLRSCLIFFSPCRGSTVWRSCRDGHVLAVQQWQTWHTICESHFRECRGTTADAVAAQFVLLWCFAVKSIRETRFSLFLSHSFATCACVSGFCASRCATHTHSWTHWRTHSHGMKRTSVRTQTHPLHAAQEI